MKLNEMVCFCVGYNVLVFREAQNKGTWLKWRMGGATYFKLQQAATGSLMNGIVVDNSLSYK